jgi:hypothetical protein
LTLDGKQIELERRAVDDLAGRFSGRLLLSDHADYDKARAIWNGPSTSFQQFSAVPIAQRSGSVDC